MVTGLENVMIGGPADADTLLLAHGAGAPMDSPFMEAMSLILAEHGIRVLRFEFGYMAGRRTTGRKAPPPRVEKLTDEFAAMAHQVEAPRLFIGGKSLGGRVASMIAGDLHDAGRIAGLVCLGYPFHPPGKPERLRTAHLKALTCPSLIVQGERDPFGNAAEVPGYAVSDRIGVVWAPDGNHDLVPRKSSGLTADDNWRAAGAAIAGFIQSGSGR